MRLFNSMKQLFVTGIIFCFLTACGGGGGGGGTTQSAASSNDNTVKEENYSISVDQSTLNIDVPFDIASNPQPVFTIKVTFNGDGLIAGFPPGEEFNSNIGIGLTSTSATTADLTIRATFTFQEAKTHTKRVRLVTGKADGSKFITKDIIVNLRQLDGLGVTTSDGSGFSGLWGGHPDKMDYQVRTLAQKWTVSSAFDGLTLSTTEGSGYRTVSVSYDYRKVPLNTQSAELVFTAESGESITKTINFDLDAPDFNTVNTDVLFPGQKLAQPVEPIDIDLQVTENQALPWTATLPEWLSAKSLTGTTGLDKLQVYVDPAQFPDQDGDLTGTIHVKAEVPGGKVERDIQVSFPYQRTRIQPSKAAFAFSDYATSQTHSDEFWLNIPIDSNTQVVSNSDWVIIDSVADQRVKFHLDTTNLPAGYQTAEISISQAGNNAFVPAKAFVGYYKSATPFTFGAAGSWPRHAYAVRDKLGPWIYVANDVKDSTSTITKYNLATRTVENTVKVTEVTGVNSLAVSDDGQYLFGLGYDENRGRMWLIKIDLKDFNTYYLLPTIASNSTELHFFTINGKPLLVSSRMFDAFTGQSVTGPAPFDTGEYSFAGYDSIGYLRYDYDYLTNQTFQGEITGLVSLPGNKGRMNLSSHGRYLGFFHQPGAGSTQKTAYVYKVDRDGNNNPTLTELHHGKTVDEPLSNYPADILVGDNGQLALFNLVEGGANKLEIYRADQSLVASYPRESLWDRKGTTWTFTADNKALVYFQVSFSESQTLYIYAVD